VYVLQMFKSRFCLHLRLISKFCIAVRQCAFYLYVAVMSTESAVKVLGQNVMGNEFIVQALPRPLGQEIPVFAEP